MAAAMPVQVLQPGLQEDRGAPVGTQAELVGIRPRIDHQRAAAGIGVTQRLGPIAGVELQSPIVQELPIGVQREGAGLVRASPGPGREDIVQGLVTPVVGGEQVDAVAPQERTGRDLLV